MNTELRIINGQFVKDGQVVKPEFGNWEQINALKRKPVALPPSHDTIVYGKDKEGTIVYVRTFDYPNEMEAAQAAFQWCLENCHTYSMGTVELLIITEPLP